ncbi:MAG: flagellar hook-basal body complex protein FliE [Planctomycetota bacterium]
MVDGIGNSGAGRAALEAALQRMRTKAAGVESVERETANEGSFASTLQAGLNKVDATIQRTESLHMEVLQGKLDIHEVAAQLKESEISFQFALQVRNKLMDAYREVMRMNV